MQNRENDIVLFMDENIQLEVPVSQDGESVWLSANQMAVLFDKDEIYLSLQKLIKITTRKKCVLMV